MCSDRLKLVDSRPSLIDYSAVEAGVTAREPFAFSREHAFQRYVLETVFDVLPDDVDQHIIDGGGDRGVDIIYIDHSSRIINICSTKTVSGFKQSQKNFPGKEVDKLISFVDELLSVSDFLIESANPALQQRIRLGWDILETDHYDIKVHLFSNQLPLALTEARRLTAALGEKNVSLHEHHLYELSHGVARSYSPQFTKSIKLIRDNCFECTEDSHRGLTAKIALLDLFQFLMDGSSRDFDNRLLRENVRYFLGTKNGVNKDIRAALMSGNASEFWAANNGITLTCDQYVATAGASFPIKLKNPRIINGGQTAHVIHSVGRDTPVLLNGVSVTVKIIETSDRQLVRRIAFGSNNQSRVLDRDLRADDPFQHELADALATMGIFYRRKRGETSHGANIPILDALRAGQLILAYAVGEPDKSKTGSNDIFGELYDRVFDPIRINPETVVTAWKVFEPIEAEVRAAAAQQRSISKNSYEEDWIIEGRFHVLFVVGQLMALSGAPLHDLAKALGYLPRAKRVVSDFATENRDIPSYRLFRLSKTTRELRKRIPDYADLGQLSLPGI